jgi:membrane protease YdiL (CAAX protease family)
VHFEVQRLFAIIALGIVLGLIYYWTRNLWVSIFAHFLFNGSQVVAAYFYQDELGEIASADGQSMPIWVTLISLPALYFIGKKLRDLNENPSLDEDLTT